MIEEKRVYVTRGKQFDTMEKALEYRDGLLGDLLDGCPAFRNIGLRERLAIIDHMSKNRDALRDLLAY
ncbi:hypothetical protein BcepSauron_017 [Burkholderia phage BcepSauron]|uniref:Uncharacterized protein n=2 Tax=Sarumanvirus TaxID=2843450 RepID=A0A482MK42_9CAUD|nr:hypothetical protein H1O16_gp017 [Burkholderia phage BcepSaruman]YP_009904395.1 hypothetical protein H1O17_gp017 [Burkholderia phage BcepSauron]QBQ74397.1 hypothetical protein BcepSauron_017 [Burkholderia phage BcepSauron]QBX06430.1 hypothetical protein BcepSaruman_017 [Burkholderia phage BcepSaruman]